MIRRVTWLDSEGWADAADALNMSLPTLVEHPHAQYWLRQGLIRAQAKQIHREQAEQQSQQ